MVLKWLGGGKPDHPLADEKGAKAVFAALPANDPVKSIEELRHWVENVLATEGFKPERIGEILLQLDETAQAHQRKLARDYFVSPPPPKVQETRIWNALFGLWKDLATGYAALIESLAADAGAAGRLKAQLPLLGVRAVRAIAAQMKWHYLHYEQADGPLWEKLGKAYRFCEERKLGKESVAVYPGVPVTSSAEREFMKAVMLAASSPDCLQPLDIELAERIVAHFSADFLIHPTHQAQVTYYWIDLARGVPPRRLTEMPPASPGLRYFAAGAAQGKLDHMIAFVERGAVPADLNLGGSYEAEKVLGVLRHLKIYWAATPPVRKHDRYAVQHKIQVVNGFEAIVKRLSGNGAAPESWAIENISAGGIGAGVARVTGDWLRIGRLVGIQVEGGSGSLSVGVVRRCNRLPQLRASVGLQTFAKDTFPVTLGGGAAQEALLLNDGRALKEEALLCMREGAFSPRNSPTMTFDDQTYLLMPVELKESGEDFELARYRVMQQS